MLIVALVANVPLGAQDLIMSTPREPVVAPVLREKELPPPPSQPPAPPDTPFKIGPIVLHPHFNYGYSNAEGLPAPDGRRIASEIHSINAGISADLGRYWSLDYSPSWMNYTARAMTDTFDQSASLSGAMVFWDWNFQVSQSYSQATPTLVETGRQTKQETWATSLGASHAFNRIVQFTASAGLNERYTDIAADTRSWNSTAMLNLVFSSRLNLNVGPNFSYTEIVDAPDMYSEGYNVRLNWVPTDKLTLGISTGMQYSHSTSSAGLDLANPLLNFSASYQPFETTTISFTAARTVSPSYFKEQVTDSVRWSVGLSQRLLGRFYLSASYAPYDTDYTAADALTQAGRKDSVDTYTAALSTQLFSRLSVSASFTKTDNKSNDPGFSFSTMQYGLQLRYSY